MQLVSVHFIAHPLPFSNTPAILRRHVLLTRSYRRIMLLLLLTLAASALRACRRHRSSFISSFPHYQGLTRITGRAGLRRCAAYLHMIIIERSQVGRRRGRDRYAAGRGSPACVTGREVRLGGKGRGLGWCGLVGRLASWPAGWRASYRSLGGTDHSCAVQCCARAIVKTDSRARCYLEEAIAASLCLAAVGRGTNVSTSFLANIVCCLEVSSTS